MKAKRGFKQFNVRIPTELHRRMKVIAASRGITMATLVEAALEQYVGPKAHDLSRLADVTRDLERPSENKP